MSTLAELTKPQEGDETDDVLFNSLYGVRLVELNRPAKFNALNGSMARKILPRLKVGTPGLQRALLGKRPAAKQFEWV